MLPRRLSLLLFICCFVSFALQMTKAEDQDPTPTPTATPVPTPEPTPFPTPEPTPTPSPASPSVLLVWDANTETSIAGYRIQVGTVSGQPSTVVDVGLSTSATVSDLVPGTTYFFNATAYDASAVESLPSVEVSYTVPGGPAPTPTPTPIATPSPTATPDPTPLPTATPIPTPLPTPTPPQTPVSNLDVAITPPSAFFTPYTSPPLDLTGGTYVLTFEGQGTGDSTAMIDAIAIDGVAVADGNFETPPQGSSFAYKPGGGAWTFVGDAGIQGNGSQWFAAPAPEGTQTAFVQNSNPSSISQTVTLSAGTHFLTFYCAQRGRFNSANQTLQVKLQPAATPSPTPSQTSLLNVSTRAYVQTGENVLIGGLIISGDVPKKVVLRAIGPSLVAAGLSNALRDPAIALYDSSGTIIGSNDNWRTSAAAVQATGLAPTNDLEAAIVTTLAPGAYTAIVSGVGGTKGIALFELYDADATASTSRIGNIATRGKVEAGNNIMIGGFIIGGTQPSQVIVRALGPSLTAGGIADALADPSLELYNGNGSRIFTNDNWRSSQEQQIVTSTLAPADDRESAIIATLQPGNYTAVVRGTGSATGVGLVEVYNLSQ